MTNMNLPIVCTLSPAALQARRAGLLSQLIGRTRDQQELPDGYRFVFDATEDIMPTVARVIDAERQCCRFLRFHLVVEPDGGPILLDLTGPPGTQEFISALLDA
jgi:hypothetical protein